MTYSRLTMFLVHNGALSPCAPKWGNNNEDEANDITEDNMGSFWRLGALSLMSTVGQ